MSRNWKGVIVAGGVGSRFAPITNAINKQLLPIYDKPLIYYPLSIMMLSGLREVAIVTSPKDVSAFELLLGDGSQFGCSFTYIVQEEAKGIAHALWCAKDFIEGSNVCLLLGDNIFFGQGMGRLLNASMQRHGWATVFGYHVANPGRFGVVDFDSNRRVISLEEKPKNPKTNYAVTGMYFYDDNVLEYIEKLKPSKRGELEITDLNKLYLEKGRLMVEVLGRGTAWLDISDAESFINANTFVQSVETRQGLKIACLEEIAYKMGYIDAAQLKKLGTVPEPTSYSNYILSLLA